MSFEPRVETRSLEASYNLTAQLRLEMMERRREEEARRKTKYEVDISPFKVRAKGRKEKEEREKEERGRRRRLNNPVWENIKAEIEVFSFSKIFSFLNKPRQRLRFLLEYFLGIFGTCLGLIFLGDQEY